MVVLQKVRLEDCEHAAHGVDDLADWRSVLRACLENDILIAFGVWCSKSKKKQVVKYRNDSDDDRQMIVLLKVHSVAVLAWCCRS